VPAPLTLTVVRAGAGSGTVTITQGDIPCEITCSASYDNGTVVTLTASARYGVFPQRLERRQLLWERLLHSDHVGRHHRHRDV